MTGLQVTGYIFQLSLPSIRGRANAVSTPNPLFRATFCFRCCLKLCLRYARLFFFLKWRRLQSLSLVCHVHWLSWFSTQRLSFASPTLYFKGIWISAKIRVSPFHPVDNIGAVMIVLNIRWKIIRTVLCCIVYDSCAQCDTHI